MPPARNQPNPAMVSMARRRSAARGASDGAAPTGSVGDPSAYNQHDPDRGALPTRSKPRRSTQRGLGAQPYRDWQPSPGQNQVN